MEHRNMPEFAERQRRPGSSQLVSAARADLSNSRFAPMAHPPLEQQQAIGNQAVQRLLLFGMIQPKLKISQPNDKYEQEADRVADQVMRMPDPRIQHQIEPEEEEEFLKAKEVPSKNPQVTSQVETHFTSLSSGGQPLPESVRAFFNPRFGYDFSQVQVYRDTRAADIAKTLHAQAFTIGNEIVFGAGRYAPGTQEGQKLLAHELTHVIQQQGTTQRLQSQASNDSSNDEVEQEGEQRAEQVTPEAGFPGEISQELVAEVSIPIEGIAPYRLSRKPEKTKANIQPLPNPISRTSSRPRIQRLCTQSAAQAGYPVRVNFRIPPTPAPNHSHSTAWVSARVGDPSGQTAGFTEYSAHMRCAVNIRFQGGRSWVTRFRAWLRSPRIRIFITNAMAVGSCEYNDLLRHERRHDTDIRSNFSDSETDVCSTAVGWPSAAHPLPTSVLSAANLETKINDWMAFENWRLNYENWSDSCVWDMVDYPRLYTGCPGTAWTAPAASCPPAPVRPVGTVFPLPRKTT
jgi:hypothetical protein